MTSSDEAGKPWEHYEAYALGEVKEEGIADAEWVVSIDRHFGLFVHFFATQIYFDNRETTHDEKWAIGHGDNLFRLWWQIVDLYKLKIMTNPGYGRK